MSELPAQEQLSRPFALTKLKVVNFRRIKRLDLDLGERCQVVCLVGSNGSGKSSLISLLIDSLCKLTVESGPDLPNKRFPVGSSEVRGRTHHTREVGQSGTAALVVAEWTFYGQRFSYFYKLTKELSRNFADQLPGEPEVVGTVFKPGDFFESTWSAQVNLTNDPVARSVFLVRPADRYEPASYEEEPDLALVPHLSTNWSGRRLFPVRVRSWGHKLEQFLLQLHLDMALRSTPAVTAYEMWAKVFQELIGVAFEAVIETYPMSRIGPSYHPKMTSLSSGELDVLVTAANILAQGLASMRKQGSGDFHPTGVVFIDEVDAHLHPRWQQTVVPILCRAFPDITFIISTHSPFVLRSLDPTTSKVVRLPDGVLFDEDFSAWHIDDILATVFDVPAEWSADIADKLKRLRTLVGQPEAGAEAQLLYDELDRHDSAGLKAEIKRVAALYGTAEFQEGLARRLLAPTDEAEAPAGPTT